MKEVSIHSILTASTAIIANPSRTIKETLGIGYADILLLNFSPSIFAAKKVYDWIKGKKQQSEEKERMYQEIIAKQQAAINKQRNVNRELERRLRLSDSQNKSNKQEISELKKQIRNLEEVIDLLDRAARQTA